MTTILIVDDDKTMQKIFQRWLESKGYATLIASDGNEAVALAQSERPGLILMDLRLPELDGWEATRQIKANLDTAHIPIIALTGASRAEERQASLDVGCDAYLVKPVPLTELAAQVAALLE